MINFIIRPLSENVNRLREATKYLAAALDKIDLSEVCCLQKLNLIRYAGSPSEQSAVERGEMPHESVTVMLFQRKSQVRYAEDCLPPPACTRRPWICILHTARLLQAARYFFARGGIIIIASLPFPWAFNTSKKGLRRVMNAAAPSLISQNDNEKGPPQNELK